jgi:hypothetical protein
VSLAADRSIRIRQYGSSQLRHCVIFFPGQHGGISTYERNLFPTIKQLGITVYALSYPGQDGAQEEVSVGWLAAAGRLGGPLGVIDHEHLNGFLASLKLKTKLFLDRHKKGLVCRPLNVKVEIALNPRLIEYRSL